MGMVDENNRVNFYDGQIRVVDPQRERVGEVSRTEVSGLRRRARGALELRQVLLSETARLEGVRGRARERCLFGGAPRPPERRRRRWPRPRHKKAREEYFATLGGKPVHHTLANHWARVIEMFYAAERMRELVNDPEITGKNIRTIPTATPTVGIGVVEAPRGTLFHHYETDEKGLIKKANLIVATQGNAARMAMGVEKSRQGSHPQGKADDGILNMIEMAFRAYDPCHGCATHSLPGEMPLIVSIRNASGRIVQEIRR